MSTDWEDSTDCLPSSDRSGARPAPQAGRGSFRDDCGPRVATERSPTAWCPASRRRGEAQSRGGEPRGRGQEGLLRAERPSWSLAHVAGGRWWARRGRRGGCRVPSPGRGARCGQEGTSRAQGLGEGVRSCGSEPQLPLHWPGAPRLA